MKTIAIPADVREQFPDLIDGMYRLRARVFKERMGWDVKVVQGREIDDFDQLPATYILLLTGSSEVSGCARLLPASGTTMLARAFPQLLSTGKLEAHAAMIESSRFCVDTTIEEGRGGGALHQATVTLLAGIIEWSMRNGYSEIVTATDVRFERILKRAGWPMRRLGEPSRIGNTIAVAGSLSADPTSLARVRPAGTPSIFNPMCRAA
ncbi:acyl-homoserine-lactone synthase TraI [Phyllobacterium endophyticum]|uniref:Acyl-homoserine-lactone synthase n=1 Tax=Phyllobacterium endophyticum TaxID=1149773 RepID=A0A2P7AKA2_9HYPH|nr:acyl-homoserine-lactone synthase TraI [Phyllobacterium endophyticum]MBB3237136.1 acyl homoserine lactone synthase [Phyllobacterium endophyticum]PSH54636.1 autoinducer synthesis protein [Phyllobacterium endophyticum]TYR40596.1 GNAT family N-acetyltransferase [Phyllobacterium endophyticum]